MLFHEARNEPGTRKQVHRLQFSPTEAVPHIQDSLADRPGQATLVTDIGDKLPSQIASILVWHNLSFKSDLEQLQLIHFFPPDVSPVRNSTTSPSAMT